MIRPATPTETEFYERTLYPMQDAVLNLLQNDRFYLGGGTCLSRYYLDHRYSDDLDIFYDGLRYPKEEFAPSFQDIVNRIGTIFRVEILLDAEFFKRMIVYRADQPLKVEFIYENFKAIGQRQQKSFGLIDALENMATNKMTAVQDRKTVKDFVDLYYLSQQFSFDQLTEWAATKMAPINYEGLLMIFADRRLEGEVILKKPLETAELKKFAHNWIDRIIHDSKLKSL